MCRGNLSALLVVGSLVISAGCRGEAGVTPAKPPPSAKGDPDQGETGATAQPTPMEEVLTEQGYRDLARGDYQGAIPLFTKAIERNPNYAPAYCGRGIAFLARGLLRVAVDDFGAALRLDPEYAEAVRQRARAYFLLNDYNRAMADCRRAIRLEPESAVGYQVFGLSSLAAEDYAGATGYIEQALDIDPGLQAELVPRLAEAYDKWGLSLDQQGRLDAAERAFAKARELDPKYFSLHEQRAERLAGPAGQAPCPNWPTARDDYQRGLEYVSRGNWEAAILAFKDAVAACDAYPEAYYQLGVAYLERGGTDPALEPLPDTAIECFDTAIRLDRKFAEAYSQRGRAQWMMRNTYDAVRDCTQAILLKPKLATPHDAEAHFWRACAYLMETEYDRAIVDFQESRRRGLEPALEDQVDRHLAEAFIGRGLKHLRAKAWQEAIDDFDRAVGIDADLAGELNLRLSDAHRELGLEHAEYWRLEEAERSLKEAVTQYDAWNAENYEALGRVYLKWAKWEEATKHFVRAIQLDPENFFWLRRKLSLAYFRWGIDAQQAGRADQAQELFKRARQWGFPLPEQPSRPVRNAGTS
jgi:tetratricopeptide (TPR) repeat protein